MQNNLKRGKYIKYHGTATYFDYIDLSKSGIKKDFGSGFYLADIYDSAYDMACKRARMQEQSYGYIYGYNIFPDLLTGLNVCRFRGTSQAWLDFIVKNRKVFNYKHEFDVVIGPIADAKTASLVDKYMDGKYGEIGSPRAVADVIVDMQIINRGTQYCFCTDDAIKKIQNQRIGYEIVYC